MDVLYVQFDLLAQGCPRGQSWPALQGVWQLCCLAAAARCGENISQKDTNINNLNLEKYS